MSAARLQKAVIAGALCGAFGLASAPSAAESITALKNRKIGYVMTDRHWSTHVTADKSECPNGLNDGPREQFKSLFPEDGTKRTLAETQLLREGQQWFPSATEEQFIFREAGGKVARGLNLDGKVDASDFTSPDGVPGVDNQLHRALGCIDTYRAPEGFVYHFENIDLRMYSFNRTLIELSEVDDLTNDPDVTVTTYRGLDSLLSDASGNSYLPGGTQRVDMRWGRDFIHSYKGRIADGVLTTEPKDGLLPWSGTFDTSSVRSLKDLRFQLKLTEQRAEGVIGAYVDVNSFIHHLNSTWSTHHQSYGQLSAPSLYRALVRLADGHPDPQTGQMTAISAAIDVQFVQVHIEHPPEQVADIGLENRAPNQTSR